MCQNGRTTQRKVVQNARTNDRPHNRPYSTGSTRCSPVSRLARSNAFEINNSLNTLKRVRLTLNLTEEARKSAVDVGRLLIITETVHSWTPSATGVIVKDTYGLCAGRLVSQSEKGKMARHMVGNEQRISQLRCSLLPHMSIYRRCYYKSRTST